MKRLTTGYISFCGVLAVLMWAIGSCIKEDVGDCLTRVALTFRYEHNPEYADLFESNVDRVRLYIYDSEGRYVAGEEASVSSMQNRNTLNLSLEEGSYRIVVWGNLNGRWFEILGGPGHTFAESSLNAITEAGQYMSDNPDNLFHGMTDLNVGRNTMVRDTVSLIRDTKNITVLVEGMEGMFGSVYQVYIKGSNGNYDFSNASVAGSPVVTYLPGYSIKTINNISYSSSAFKVMRVQTGSDLTLTITEGAEILASDNVAALLLANFPQIQTDEDLDRYHDYTFVYRFTPSVPNQTFTLISIQVGPWEAVSGRPGGI